VADRWQGRGIGAQLVHCTVDVARGEHVAHLLAEFTPDNARMHELLASEGFSFSEHEDVVVASLKVD